MKTNIIFRFLAIPLFLVAIACTDYQDDIDKLGNRVEDLEQRVQSLEDWQSAVNRNINAISTMVDAAENNYFITGFEEVAAAEGGGYKMIVKKGNTSQEIRIKNGENGNSPVVGVKKEGDNWFWTIDGEWLLDTSGNKVYAKGENGKTPKVKIGDDGYWYISATGEDTDYVNTNVKAQGTSGSSGTSGNTPKVKIGDDGYWYVSATGEDADFVNTNVKAQGTSGNTPKVKIGDDGYWYVSATGEDDDFVTTNIKAQGDAYFASDPVINETEGYVEFTLADGETTFRIPYYNANEPFKSLQSIVYVPTHNDGKISIEGSTVTINYKVMPKSMAVLIKDQVSSGKDILKLVPLAVQTRVANPTLTINKSNIAGFNDGTLCITASVSGFEADKNYAIALELDDGNTMYSTAYSPAYVVVHAHSIAIAAQGYSPNSGTFSVGRTLLLSPVFTAENTTERGVTWSSSNPTVASIGETSGFVTALADGTTTVTVRSTDDTGISETIDLTVSGGQILLDTSPLSQSQAQAKWFGF